MLRQNQTTSVCCCSCSCASRYINFTWDCNRRYSPHMRSWQIAPLQSAIENNYQRRLDQKNQYLMASVACSLVLLILLILVSTKKKRE